MSLYYTGVVHRDSSLRPSILGAAAAAAGAAAVVLLVAAAVVMAARRWRRAPQSHLPPALAQGKLPVSTPPPRWAEPAGDACIVTVTAAAPAAPPPSGPLQPPNEARK